MLVSIPLYRKVQARLDRLLGITRENLTGVRVLRAFCKENEEIAEFEERNEALTGVQKFVGRISALMNPVTYIIINLAVVALIWTGAIRVEAGILTQEMCIRDRDHAVPPRQAVHKWRTRFPDSRNTVHCLHG